MSIPPKDINIFNAMLIKTTYYIFTELEQIFQKFIWNYKKTQNYQSNPELRNKA